jgi:hypothetical protein
MNVWMSAAEQAEVWDRYEAGEYMRPIARAVGRSQAAVRSLIAKTGGVRPLVPTDWSDLRLSLAEREVISRGIAAERFCHLPGPCSLDDLEGDRRQRRTRSLPLMRGRDVGTSACSASQIGQAGSLPQAAADGGGKA